MYLMNGKSDETKQYLQFARLLISGSGITEAYRKVFDCKGESKADVAAYRFAKNVNVLNFIKKLREAKDETKTKRSISPKSAHGLLYL